jgi:hypothetical protein
MYNPDSTHQYPPYVMLTRSFNYLGNLNTTQLENLYVHNAQVQVSDGTDSVMLQEICLNNIPPQLRGQVAGALGLGSIDSVKLNVCIYADLTFKLHIAEGKKYDLKIIADGKTVTSSTTVPRLVPMDSVKWRYNPNYPQNDSLFEARSFISDPANEKNYYRYFTKRNHEPMYPGSRSVTEDNIFDGRSFEFPVRRAQSKYAPFDFRTNGYFWRGDTAIIRLGNIDYDQFRFWQTTEANSGSNSPFSSYVRTLSNIKGGLGVWAGMSYKDYLLIFPK